MSSSSSYRYCICFALRSSIFDKCSSLKSIPESQQEAFSTIGLSFLFYYAFWWHFSSLEFFGSELLFRYYFQRKPGLSAYPSDPRQSANSLVALLEKAEASVPRELRPKTPVRVGVWKTAPFTKTSE